jgi:hypothetical protein
MVGLSNEWLSTVEAFETASTSDHSGQDWGRLGARSCYLRSELVVQRLQSQRME